MLAGQGEEVSVLLSVTIDSRYINSRSVNIIFIFSFQDFRIGAAKAEAEKQLQQQRKVRQQPAPCDPCDL